MADSAVRKSPIVLTVFLTLLWITTTWAPSRDEFSRLDTENVFTYVLLVLAVEVLFYIALSLLTARFGGRILTSILNALFVLFNVYTIVLVHVEYLQGASESIFYLVLAGIFSVALVLFEFAQSRVLLVLSTVAALYTVFIATDVYLQENQRSILGAKSDRIFEDSRWKFPAAVVYPQFKTKRNVYIVSFDALISEAVSKKLLGIEKLSYVDAVRRKGGTLLPNSFSFQQSTVGTLNEMLSLDTSLWQSLSGNYKLVTGEYPSPVYEIFRKNGYKIQFLYGTSYFGPKKTAGIDYYDFTSAIGICLHIDNKLAFMGYCLPRLEAYRTWVYGARDFPQMLFERVTFAAKSDDPWLTVSYIYSPGHTLSKFRAGDETSYKEYKAYFLNNLKQTTLYINTLIDNVQENDPNGILLIAGDHGAWMTRGIDINKLPPDSPYDMATLMQDRNGVFGVIFAEDFCNVGGDRLVAVTTMVRRIIKCLGGGGRPPLSGPV